MNHFRLIPLLGCLLATGGCATDGPATNGASVRTMVARQIADPSPQRAPATIDGAAAVDIVKNYNGSYATPQPQVAGSAFGR
jgi:hypothetical protein